MKPTNKDLKKCRDKVKELQVLLFETLGGVDSVAFRVQLGGIANNILHMMKENEINGDETVNYL